MIAATSPSGVSVIVTAVAMTVCLGCFTPAWAQAASGSEIASDTDNGRYTLSPTQGGVVRLDTRTGSVSNCRDKGNGWACYTLPDERKALDEEIGRLQAENEQLKALRAENERLKAELAERPPAAPGKIEEALPKSDSLKPARPDVGDSKSAEAGRNRIEIPLPSDRDMDRIMSFVERAWRRLIDMADRVHRDVSGRI